MNPRWSRPSMMSLAVAMACAATSQANAQEAPTAAPEETAGPQDDTQPLAEPDAEEAIGEIVVTARRREEFAQDAPVSLVVSTGEMLRDRSVTEFSELELATPSFQASPSLFGNTSLILSSRGLSLTDIRLNIDPVVGIYVDGVYIPRAVGINAGELIDIQRVEVLAGPQGTLFGKNSSGGAVRIFTETPSNQLEGFVRARVESLGLASVSGVINIPITPTLAVRAVASITESDGYGTNLLDNSSTGEFDSRSLRLSAEWRPSDRLTMTLRGDYLKSDSVRPLSRGFQSLAPLTPGVGLGGPAATVEAALEINQIPNTAAFLALPLATRQALLADADAQLRALSLGDPDDATNDQPAEERATVWGASFNLDYRLSDNIGLNWLSAVRSFEREGTGDLDGTPFAIINYPYLYATETQYSTELQVSGSFLEDRLQSILGVYYSKADGREVSHQLNVALIGGATALGIQNADTVSESIGLFTQHTFSVTESLDVTGGIRFSRDNRELISNNYNSAICLSLGQTLAAIGGAANCIRPMQVDFDQISYTASVEYEPAEDVLVYATTRRGYRAGGLQEAVSGTTPAAADTAFTPYDPEIVVDYEIGLKSYFFDRRLRFNVNFYHSDIEGGIRFAPSPVAGTTLTAARLQNAAQIDVDGIEFDILAKPLPGLDLGVTGAWTNARFVEYITPTGVDFSNLDVQYSPEWRYALTAAYETEVFNASWRTQVDYSWTDRQLTVEPNAYAPANGILNVRTSFDWEAQGIELAIFVKNLTEERFTPSPIDLSALGFVAAGPYNPPRSFGFEVTKRF